MADRTLYEQTLPSPGSWQQDLRNNKQKKASVPGKTAALGRQQRTDPMHVFKTNYFASIIGAQKSGRAEGQRISTHGSRNQPNNLLGRKTSHRELRPSSKKDAVKDYRKEEGGPSNEQQKRLTSDLSRTTNRFFLDFCDSELAKRVIRRHDPRGPAGSKINYQK